VIVPLLVFVAVAAAVVTTLALRARARRAEQAVAEQARADADAARKAAALEAAAARRAAETAARTEALELRAAADAELGELAGKLARRDDAIARVAADLRGRLADLDHREATLDEDARGVQSKRDRATGIERDADRRHKDKRAELERVAGTRAEELARELASRWVDDVRAEAAAKVRLVDQSAADPAHDRQARRVLDIAAARIGNHYLTERNVSNLRLDPPVADALVADDGIIHLALQEVCNVQFLLNEDRSMVRLDSQDGVGKEIARRAIAKLHKKQGALDEARCDPKGWVLAVRQQLEQEIKNLGRKAFQVLEIPRPHPEIVDLVGALNYRTSFTQNQWHHAVESSFLAGMMAAELGLDEKLARRATLMHDIGKALTHKIEGSHAVIGADIARRLGEAEIVANAIGAHHTDEPFNSAYAYLVAAADAMSGARPGARREATEGFSTKIDDLERIGLRHRGVDRAHAVFGGRELRIYVREREVDDLRVVELSSEIAAQIADEMTFPGQIKVTVIRAVEAVATAS